MQLTRFTDYALRVLLFVGKEQGRRCTIAQIARYYRISPEHLRKVVHRMAKDGYLVSSRGRRGGLVLGRDPAQIRIGEVIVAMEEQLHVIDCEALQCVLVPDCSLKRALDRASHAFIAALDEVTLGDLLASVRMKRQFKALDIAVRTESSSRC
jgi:Rrf2 family nitric oxide-sensitive transcriptional repressor